jgi:hypothetical protein
MKTLNAKYADGWKEATVMGAPSVLLTEPAIYGMAHRISQANAKILGFIGMVLPLVGHTVWASTHQEGEERRALATSYAYNLQRCDPTK